MKEVAWRGAEPAGWSWPSCSSSPSSPPSRSRSGSRSGRTPQRRRRGAPHEGFARAWTTGSLASVRFDGTTGRGRRQTRRHRDRRADLGGEGPAHRGRRPLRDAAGQGRLDGAAAGHVDARRRPALELRDDGRPRRERRRLVRRVDTDAGPPGAHRLRHPDDDPDHGGPGPHPRGRRSGARRPAGRRVRRHRAPRDPRPRELPPHRSPPLVDVDAGALTRAVQAAKPTAFVDVITLRTEAYAPLERKLSAIPGVVTRSRHALARTDRDVRPGAARQRRTGHEGDRRRLGRARAGHRRHRPQRAAADLRRPVGRNPRPRRQGRHDGGAERAARARQGRHDDARPLRAGRRRERARRGDQARRAGGDQAEHRRRRRRRQRRAERRRVRPRAARPVPAGLDLQGRLGLRPAAAGLHRDDAGPLPAERDDRGPDDPQRRERGARHGAVPHRLRPVLQQRLRRQPDEDLPATARLRRGGPRLRGARRPRRPGLRRERADDGRARSSTAST